MDRESLRYLPGVALGGIVILLSLFLILLLVQLREIIAVVFLGFIVGVTLTPLAEYLHRYHVPRIISVLGVYALTLGTIIAFVWYTIPLLVDEFAQAADELDRLRDRYQELSEETPLPPAEDVTTFLENQLGGMVGGLVTVPFVLFTAVLYSVTIFIIGLLFTITKDRMHHVVLSLVSPEQRALVEDVLGKVGHKLRRYVVAELLTMVVVGVLSYIGLTLLGIPFAAALAGIAFIFELIPIIGPWLAFFPALGVALTQGIVPAIAVSILYLAIQQFESHVVVPVVQGRGVEIPALLIVIAVLVGGALMGVLGVLIAIPTAVIFHTLFWEVVVPWRQRQLEARQPEERPPGLAGVRRGGSDADGA